MKLLSLLLLFIFILSIGTRLFSHLLQQSKHPKGIIGNVMMKIWNSSYLPMVRWSTTFLPVQKTRNILDIGIGNGLSTYFLANKFSQAQVFGIDLSSDAIAACEKKTSEHNNITFSVESIEKTAFYNKQFQLITAFQTHFHWENLAQCFDELNRIMADKGLLLIACEDSKIKYFLKEFRTTNEFELFLNERELRHCSTYQKTGWICYIISKD